MNIREQARKQGGEELVARLDAALALREKLSKVVHDAVAQIIEEGKDDEAGTISAVCEALSFSLGKAVVAMHELDPKTHSKTEVVVMTIRSVTNNINAMFEEVAVKKSGVSDLIVAAAKKGGVEK